MNLISSTLMQKLSRSRLLTRFAVASEGVGERRSRSKGAGMEFEDYRAYQPGDNVRHIDRNVYMRTGQHYVKRFSTYKQLPVTILVDVSQSMESGYPRKLDFCKRMAAGLAFVAASGGDLVLLGAVERDVHWHPRVQGVMRLASLFSWLDEIQGGGAVNTGVLESRIRNRVTGEGMTILLSDFMFDGVDKILSVLRGLGQEVVGVHVLSPDERDPGNLGVGDLLLIDSEDANEVEASLGPELIHRYRQELVHWTGELREHLHQGRGWYLPVTTSDSIDDLLCRQWRLEGLIQ